MYVLLIVVKELVLLFGELIVLECYFESMCWFWWVLESHIFALVYSTD